MRIQKLIPAEEVTTVSGSGQVGWQDGLAMEARFMFPSCARKFGGALLVVLYGALHPEDQSIRHRLHSGVPGESGHRDGPARYAAMSDLLQNVTQVDVLNAQFDASMDASDEDAACPEATRIGVQWPP
eukprot:GGOE01029965.1.p3 GENE.GGOE01029965.1~~GGOE01029965.1.p3  ORF type:complete len:128 (-),score=8.40 GGOE01029965.1:375-758(-)